MTERTEKNIKKWFAVFISVWTAVVAVLFIVQVWRIYSFGESAYTTQRIAEMFSQIAVPVWIWLAAIVVGGVLWLTFPEPEKQIAPLVESKDTLARLQRRLPGNQRRYLLMKHENQQDIVLIICTTLGCICLGIAFLCIVGKYQTTATEGFFAAHEEAERILRALVWVLGAVVAAFVAVYFTEYSYKKQIALVKTTIAENAKQGIKAAAREEKSFSEKVSAKLPFLKSKWFTLGVRAAIAAVAIVFIVIGISNGGMAAVLDKAVKICSQCIGIG